MNLIYTEDRNEDNPVATIHNLDTGLSYRLALSTARHSAPHISVAVIPAALTSMDAFGYGISPTYYGDEALAFWRLLCSTGPLGAVGLCKSFQAMLLELHAEVHAAYEERMSRRGPENQHPDDDSPF